MKNSKMMKISDVFSDESGSKRQYNDELNMDDFIASKQKEKEQRSSKQKKIVGGNQQYSSRFLAPAKPEEPKQNMQSTRFMA